LPDGWPGGFLLLAIIFLLSTFLDNIAAAMIGGTVAQAVYRGKVHLGFLAAIVAASNAGGAGSVLGDTTTTMMWIEGISAFTVLHAFIASGAALLVFGLVAARQQTRVSAVFRDARVFPVDWPRLGIVALMLGGAIATNILLDFPAVGVWAGLLLGLFLRKPAWKLMPAAAKGSLFLLSLVTAASMMPVEELPAASWPTTFMLGFVSAVFDNIPLTKLALDQMGYDWGTLAYAVGFGGSMIWFGSSAGVALSNMYPQIRSVGAWLKNGWHIAVAYVIGFFVLLLVNGWHPDPPHKPPASAAVTHKP
jgi:Na+/H+ antiporter NhaD/arsenite permease-like protein